MRKTILLSTTSCIIAALYCVWLLGSKARPVDKHDVAPMVVAAPALPLDVPIAAAAKEPPPAKSEAKMDCPGCPGARHDGQRRDSTTPEDDEQADPGDEWLPPPLPDSGVFIFDTTEESARQVGTWTFGSDGLSLSTDFDLAPTLEGARVEMAAMMERLGRPQRVGHIEDGYEVAIAGPRRVLMRHASGRDFIEATYSEGKLKHLQRIHVENRGPEAGPWRFVLQPR